jgi:hypothetical protein
MPVPFQDFERPFERGVVVLSFDVEQIWGYVDLLDETQFRQQHPRAIEAHTRMLDCLGAADIQATWFLVGALALRGSQGDRDRRMAGLPYSWTTRIPAGDELTAPLWYRHSFLKRLRELRPHQEIGLHGGLTHFIWTHPLATREVMEWELAEGVRALEDAGVTPVSFSFGREQEAFHSLLPAHGIICYRGRTVAPSFRLGPTIYGKAARLFDEMRRATPRVVWPSETLPGLWNIPSSLFLYPIHPSRMRFAGIQSRVDRFSRGIEAAARHRGIFHFCLHPENLTQSARGFAMFEQLLELMAASRRRGDIEILTMRDVAVRMECARTRGTSDHHVPVCNRLHETVQAPKSATLHSTLKWRLPFKGDNP